MIGPHAKRVTKLDASERSGTSAITSATAWGEAVVLGEAVVSEYFSA
jgi:hypothetical protein